MFRFNYPKKVYCNISLDNNQKQNNRNLPNSKQNVKLPNQDKVRVPGDAKMNTPQNSVQSFPTITLEETKLLTEPVITATAITPSNSTDSKSGMEPLNSPSKVVITSNIIQSANSSVIKEGTLPSKNAANKPALSQRYKPNPFPKRPAQLKPKSPQVNAVHYATPQTMKLPDYLIRPYLPQVAKKTPSLKPISSQFKRKLTNVTKPASRASLSIEIKIPIAADNSLVTKETKVPTASDKSPISNEAKKIAPSFHSQINQNKTSQEETAKKNPWWLQYDEYLETIIDK